MAPLTDEECELYDHIDFDMEEFAKDVGAGTLLHSCKVLLAPPLTLCRPLGLQCRRFILRELPLKSLQKQDVVGSY